VRLSGQFDTVPEPIGQRAGFARALGASVYLQERIALAWAQFERIERCACGATRRSRPERHAVRDWFRRNDHLADGPFRQHPPIDHMGRVEPADVAGQVGRGDRPVAGAGRAVDAAAEGVARRGAVDFARGQEGANLEVQVVRCCITAPQHRADQRAAHNMLPNLYIQLGIKVAIHRERVVGMADDHDPAGIVRTGVDDLTIGDGIDPGASGIALDGVPILAGVPVAGIVPGVLDLHAVPNKEAGAQRPTRCSDRITKRWERRGRHGWSKRGARSTTMGRKPYRANQNARVGLARLAPKIRTRLFFYTNS
jgi:hypothetical protein